jgi:hypothetical protein
MLTFQARFYDRQGDFVLNSIRQFLLAHGVLKHGVTSDHFHVFHRPSNPNAKFKLSSVDRKFLARAVATLHDVPSDKGNACDDALVKHMNDTADLVPLL